MKNINGRVEINMKATIKQAKSNDILVVPLIIQGNLAMRMTIFLTPTACG